LAAPLPEPNSPSVQPISDGSDITIEHAGSWLGLPVDASTVYEAPQPYDE
jgi:hypothetical protein